MHTYLDLDGPPPRIEGGYLVIEDGDGAQLRTPVLGGRHEHVHEQLRLAIGAIEDRFGFTEPTTVIASELDDSWVGHQFRLCLPPLSDGTVPYTAWADIERIEPSPFGWCVTVHATDGTFAEVDLNDAVQVRRRLSLAEINEQPKAVA